MGFAVQTECPLRGLSSANPPNTSYPGSPHLVFGSPSLKGKAEGCQIPQEAPSGSLKPNIGAQIITYTIFGVSLL